MDAGEGTTSHVLKVLWGYVRPFWKHLVGAFGLLAARGAMDLLRPWPLKLAVDTVVHTAETGADLGFPKLAAICLMLVAVGLLAGLFTYMLTYVVNRAGREIVSNVRTASFSQMQKMSLKGKSKRQSGDLLVRLTADVRALNRAFTESLVEVIYGVVFAISMAGVLIWLDWQLGLAALAVMPFLAFMLRRNIMQIGASSKAERQSEGSLATIFQESIQTAGVTRLFNKEVDATNRFRRQSDAAIERGVANKLARERTAWMVDIAGAISVAAVLGFGMHRVSTGAITPGELVVVVTYVRGLYGPARNAAKGFGIIVRSLPPAERLVELLEAREGEVEDADAKTARFANGNIAFRRVEFSYERGNPTLKDINVDMNDRELTAIVGPTGSGKSTLLSLIPRLFDPDHGKVYAAGKDVRKFTKESLREQISVVPQEASLFSSSIADNIAFGHSDAALWEVEEAAWIVGAHEFIRRQPQGYNTPLGERGDSLSGGQRRLLTIARALVRDSVVIALDEPLAGLDPDSAALVMDSIESIRGEKTIIMVTHDLNYASHADRIIVMSEGRVVEVGKHLELYANQGVYRRLYDAQNATNATKDSGDPDDATPIPFPSRNSDLIPSNVIVQQATQGLS